MIVKVCKYAVNHYCRHTTFTIVLVQNWVLLLAHLQCECVCVVTYELLSHLSSVRTGSISKYDAYTQQEPP